MGTLRNYDAAKAIVKAHWAEKPLRNTISDTIDFNRTVDAVRAQLDAGVTNPYVPNLED